MRHPPEAKLPHAASHQPTKAELVLLLRLAKALMTSVNIEDALRIVAQHLKSLGADEVLLIGAGESGDGCYCFDMAHAESSAVRDHRVCSRVRKSLGSGRHELPLRALPLDDGKCIAVPLSADGDSAYLALGWRSPPGQDIVRQARNLLPCISELASCRFDSLLAQWHKDESVREQNQLFAAAESRHIEELRVSEHEKVEARALAALDELTGLQNRRGFLAKSEQCLLIARRQKLACVVIFADVDGLKAVNDKFGHAAGDGLIRDAARIFSSAFRHADVVGRVGGDEFAAFTFDNATPRAIIERMDARIREFNRERPTGFAISLSVGVINCDIGSEESLADYLLRADEEMYRHKRRTRRLAN